MGGLEILELLFHTPILETKGHREIRDIGTFNRIFVSCGIFFCLRSAC